MRFAVSIEDGNLIGVGSKASTLNRGAIQYNEV